VLDGYLVYTFIRLINKLLRIRYTRTTISASQGVHCVCWMRLIHAFAITVGFTCKHNLLCYNTVNINTRMLWRGVARVASQNELAMWWGCSCWRRSTTKPPTHTWHEFVSSDPDSGALGFLAEQCALSIDELISHENLWYLLKNEFIILKVIDT
jgi:hypothetical protein